METKATMMGGDKKMHTVKEMQEMARHCEEEMLNHIKKFETDTGFKINYISLERFDMHGSIGKSSPLVGVSFDLTFVK